MLSINKVYCWIFILAFATLVPSIHLLKFVDELMVLLMACLVVLDVLVNRSVKRYKLLWIIVGIMAFYMVYTIFFMKYNTMEAIIYDFVAELKPFCYFCVGYAIKPKFNKTEKSILRNISIFNSALMFCLFVTNLHEEVVFHVAFLGLVSIISFLVYLLVTVDENGKLSKKEVLTAVLILTVGLVSTRSKFYGEYVLALSMLFFYRPGFMKNIKLSHIFGLVAIVVLVFVVAWSKIDYYFISGGQEGQAFDEDLLETFARPMLYAGMVMVLLMHPIFGSGLASFATFASSTAVNYSGLYREIGLDQIWGLSPQYDAFICDAFYPSLAQFGLVGIILFVCFFVWMFRVMNICLHSSGKINYRIGVMSIIIILIESVAGTTFTQSAGAVCMMILGYLLSDYRELSKTAKKEILELPYKEQGSLDYIKK